MSEDESRGASASINLSDSKHVQVVFVPVLNKRSDPGKSDSFFYILRLK